MIKLCEGSSNEIICEYDYSDDYIKISKKNIEIKLLYARANDVFYNRIIDVINNPNIQFPFTINYDNDTWFIINKHDITYHNISYNNVIDMTFNLGKYDVMHQLYKFSEICHQIIEINNKYK